MHICQQCGSAHACEDIIDRIWRDARTLPPYEIMNNCPFHENQGARSLWTCTVCANATWSTVVCPQLRNTINGVPRQLPEGARLCGCNNCVR